MITVVSLSPAIDRRLEFDGFAIGKTNRVLAESAEGAGKGVDVALACRALGLPVRCVGILAAGGEPVTERLDRNGVPHTFFTAPGRVRVNQKLYDRRTGEVTEVNAPCPEAPAVLLSRLADSAVSLAETSNYLVLTGSLPQGCPPGYYAEIVERAHREAPDCRCVLDADGESLRAGIAARPYLIKPNLQELAGAVGRPLRSRAEMLEAARTLCAQGAEVVAASLGKEGALVVTEAEAYFAPAVRRPIQTTTGAGDALVGGLLKGLREAGAPLQDALRHGVAAATARCAHGGDAFVNSAAYAALLPEVAVRALP